jgi:hypothetical protein
VNSIFVSYELIITSAVPELAVDELTVPPAVDVVTPVNEESVTTIIPPPPPD